MPDPVMNFELVESCPSIRRGCTPAANSCESLVLRFSGPGPEEWDPELPQWGHRVGNCLHGCSGNGIPISWVFLHV